MELLAQVNRELGVTVLVSLHQVDFAFAFCPRTIALCAGRVVYDGPTRALSTARLRELYGSQTDELLIGRHDTIDSQPMPTQSATPALQIA
jgi:phosphonate transport system ATP-binding protein